MNFSIGNLNTHTQGLNRGISSTNKEDTSIPDLNAKSFNAPKSQDDNVEISASGTEKSKRDPISVNRNNPLLAEASSRQLGKIEELFERLNGDQQMVLINSDAAFDDDFLALAASLEDDQLKQFVNIAEAMSIDPQATYQAFNEEGRSLKEKLSEFVDLLKESSSSDQSKLLEIASQHAANVNIYEDGSEITSEGHGYNFNEFNMKLSSSSSNLHNFVSAAIESNDLKGFLDGLDSLSTLEQSDLLNVYGMDHESGVRMNDLLKTLGEGVKDMMVYLSSIAQGAQFFTEDDDEERDTEESDVDGTVVDVSNADKEKSTRRSVLELNSTDFVKDLIDKTLNVMEDIGPDSERWTTVASNLMSYSREDQVALIRLQQYAIDHGII